MLSRVPRDAKAKKERERERKKGSPIANKRQGKASETRAPSLSILVRSLFSLRAPLSQRVSPFIHLIMIRPPPRKKQPARPPKKQKRTATKSCEPIPSFSASFPFPTPPSRLSRTALPILHYVTAIRCLACCDQPPAHPTLLLYIPPNTTTTIVEAVSQFLIRVVIVSRSPSNDTGSMK